MAVSHNTAFSAEGNKLYDVFNCNLVPRMVFCYKFRSFIVNKHLEYSNYVQSLHLILKGSVHDIVHLGFMNRCLSNNYNEDENRFVS
jgi:hypothetical protein